MLAVHLDDKNYRVSIVSAVKILIISTCFGRYLHILHVVVVMVVEWQTLLTEVFIVHFSVFSLRPPFSTPYSSYYYYRIRNCLSQDRSVDKSDVIV